MSTPALPFTGERFTPECVREIWYEHWHRYAFAAPLARGRRVLDAACGEGYGSALLAREAQQVLGVDIDPASIAHARERYGERGALRFVEADVAHLDALADASFDLIVSFETLEHLEAQETMLDGFRRLLAPGGVLLVSTPDRRTYSDLTGFRNEHHVRELYRDQFEALLADRFPSSRLYGQKLLFQGVLWDLAHSGCAEAAVLDADGGLRAGLDYPPLYYLAACAREAAAIDALPAVHLFGGAAESVYRHYEDEIRKGIAAGHRLIALEAELAAERTARCELEARLAGLAGAP
jgi:SAM-dependent methyltransferase